MNLALVLRSGGSENERAAHSVAIALNFAEILLIYFFDVKVVVLVTRGSGFVGRPTSLMIVDDYFDSEGKYYYQVS